MENLQLDLRKLSDVIIDVNIEAMKKEYLSLKIIDKDDKVGYKRVFGAQQKVKKHRLKIEETRKVLKKDALEYGRQVDTKAKEIQALIAPIEDHLVAERKRIDDEMSAIKARIEYNTEVIEVWVNAHAENDAFDLRIKKEAELAQQAIDQEKKDAELKAKADEIARKEREAEIREEERKKASEDNKASVNQAAAEASQKATGKTRSEMLVRIGTSLDVESCGNMTYVEWRNYYDGVYAKYLKSQKQEAVETAEKEKVELKYDGTNKENVKAYLVSLWNIPVPNVDHETKILLNAFRGEWKILANNVYKSIK